jgi:membrane-bound lytic murein transglycosylase B
MLDEILKSAHRRLACCGMAVLAVLLAGLVVPALAADSPGPFDSLQERLIADGFDSARIETLFASPEVSFEEGGVSAYFMHNESKLNYKQFSRARNLALAKSYMMDHHEALAFAEKTYAVDKEVITAIILVETKLGTFVGKKSVINTLATLSAMRDEKPRQAIWDSLPDDEQKNVPQKI